MAIELYNATVKYAASPEPYDSGHGPSHNVRLTFENPSAPKTDGNNENNVYKKTGTREADYMLSLSTGDKVQVAWNSKGDKGWYDFIIPADFVVQPKATATTAPVQAVTHGPVAMEWVEPDSVYWEIWDKALDMEAKKIDTALVTSSAMLGESYSHEDIVRVAMEMYRRASIHAKPGLALQKSTSGAVDNTDRDTSLLLMLDVDDLVTSFLNAVIELSTGFYSATGLKNMLKEFGIGSKDITDQDSCIRIAHIAWDYADMVSAGSSESVATSAVADKYDLMPF